MLNKSLSILCLIFFLIPCKTLALNPEKMTEERVQSISVKKIKFSPQKITQSPIDISYRPDGKEEGKGAFYDHYTVQKSTKHETCLVKSPNAESKLHQYVKQQTFNLPYGTEDDESKKNIPPIKNGWNKNGGLLFIPGRAKDSNDQEREKLELEMIRQARLQGRPILSVCAGSWRLWEAYGGQTKEVQDHNYNGGMLRLNNDGVVTYNVQVHGVKIKSKTLLLSIMRQTPAKSIIETVNSVHWLAPDDKVKPKLPKDEQKKDHVRALYKLLKVSGRAVVDQDISLNTRQGKKMSPEEETVEAFETLFGAPVIGVLWHPEAYCRYKGKDKKISQHSEQRGILEFMAKAGDAYAARKRMTAEFKEIVQNKDNNFKDKAISKYILSVFQKNNRIKNVEPSIPHIIPSIISASLSKPQDIRSSSSAIFVSSNHQENLSTLKRIMTKELPEMGVKKQKDIINIVSPLLDVGTNSTNYYRSILGGTRQDSSPKKCIKNYLKWKRTITGANHIT